MESREHYVTQPASRVVVLGGTSGIGLAVAQSASEAGAAVVVASRNPDSVTAPLKKLPDNAVGHSVDASSTESLRAFFDEIGQFDHTSPTPQQTPTCRSFRRTYYAAKSRPSSARAVRTMWPTRRLRCARTQRSTFSSTAAGRATLPAGPRLHYPRRLTGIRTGVVCMTWQALGADTRHAAVSSARSL
ncbi:SDR family NAD(P)-dependent oxidoreductase [Rhodococcus sp. NPDC127530]|uniref:SDR family NAD(P)-dependent oxidoreductase n=1 Tax=unclassified Rhodococcus (in: high G+C Gram-positive bacteria) TaxID=192944 RepID=UPI00363F707B